MIEEDKSSRSQPGCAASLATSGAEPSAQFTPGPWEVSDCEPTRVQCVARGEEIVNTRFATEKSPSDVVGNARLIAAAPDLYEALKEAQQVIDDTQSELHRRRIADWYPEGAHNAAESMSEDMRLIGNELANVSFSAVISKAEGKL